MGRATKKVHTTSLDVLHTPGYHFVLTSEFAANKTGLFGREAIFCGLYPILVEKQDSVDEKTFFFTDFGGTRANPLFVHER